MAEDGFNQLAVATDSSAPRRVRTTALAIDKAETGLRASPVSVSPHLGNALRSRFQQTITGRMDFG